LSEEDSHTLTEEERIYQLYREVVQVESTSYRKKLDVPSSLENTASVHDEASEVQTAACDEGASSSDERGGTRILI
jgi:hypothetical protein